MTENWVGRGLDDVPGKPFGWAWHQERDQIKAHLRRQLWRYHVGDGPGTPGQRLDARVDAIQRRLHRYRKTMKERQAIWLAKHPPKDPPADFTTEELERLVELFSSANDPVTQSIAAKAQARLDR